VSIPQRRDETQRCEIERVPVGRASRTIHVLAKRRVDVRAGRGVPVRKVLLNEFVGSLRDGHAVGSGEVAGDDGQGQQGADKQRRADDHRILDAARRQTVGT
jgi:hypothetical protein